VHVFARSQTLGDQSQRTAKAVAWLRANYSKPLRVEELAETAGMGVCTLHHHFRALTAMSPLQYQKQLRLQAARGRMLTDGLDATSAAFEVDTKAPANSTGNTAVSSANRRCGIFGPSPRQTLRHWSSSVIDKWQHSVRLPSLAGLKLLNGPSLFQQGHCSPLTRAAKPQRISQGRTLHDLARPLVVARKFRANCKVRTAFNQ
jgi:AraC-like DNA-binding protein